MHRRGLLLMLQQPRPQGPTLRLGSVPKRRSGR